MFCNLVNMSPYKFVYYVINGLDVYKTGMHELIKCLKNMYEVRQRMAKSRSGLKIFCTSRPEQSILNI